MTAHVPYRRGMLYSEGLDVSIFIKEVIKQKYQRLLPEILCINIF